MTASMMPRSTARLAAAAFVHHVTRHESQWRAADIEGYLPRGWRLAEGCDEDDFAPLTITHVTTAIRRFARREY